MRKSDRFKFLNWHCPKLALPSSGPSPNLHFPQLTLTPTDPRPGQLGASNFHIISDFKGDVNYFLKANEDRIKNQRKADIETEILGVELLEDNL